MFKIYTRFALPLLCVLVSFFQSAADTRHDSFDVQHYRINLSIRNLASKQINGFTEVKMVSRRNGLSQIRLDLLSLNVDRVTQNNTLSYSQAGEQLLITLENTYQLNDTFTVKIHYSGQPVQDPRWGGFYFSGNYAYNMGVGMGSVPHAFGRCWFPCVDNFTDRATYDFHITTDSGFTAVCGGVLTDSIHSGDSITWKWQLSQSIPTYLAAVAVGNYSFVKSFYKGIPVWLAAEAKDTLNLKGSFAPLIDALTCFEDKFGPYLFDRVGFVGVPFTSGAMEHATNIAYPLYAINGTLANETLLAHELSHHWWGNLVTCSTSQDMWLNEGWASYCEAVYLECRYGKAAYYNDIKEKNNDVNVLAARRDGAWLPVSGVSNKNTYGTHVYTKGALVAHNLRQAMGDSAFFTACKSYLNKHRFSATSTNDLKNEFQRFTSVTLSDFFDVWAYDSGHVSLALDLINADEPDDVGFYYDSYVIKETNKFKRKSGVINQAFISVYYRDSVRKFNLPLQNGVSQPFFVEGNIFNNPVMAVTVNEHEGAAIAANYQQVNLKTINTGQNLTDVLLSINPRKLKDSCMLTAAHHWTAPLDVTELYEQGIRINTDRYWRVNLSNPLDEIWGFFGYDGSSNAFLDNVFLRNLVNEDSLVLLYRNKQLEDKRFRMITATLQSGASKTDKTGQFWLTNLLEGEYAIGIRDYRVVGLAKPWNKLQQSLFELYPNPAELNTTITNTSGSKLTIKIANQLGIVVYELDVNDDYKLNTALWPKGLYFIHAATEFYSETKKLVIQ